MKLISEEAIDVDFVTEEDENKKKSYFIAYKKINSRF